MAYVKLYKVVTDGPIGYQTVNQLADNAADLRTQMLVEHGDHEAGSGVLRGASAADYNALGKHNLEEVPRTVGYAATYIQTISTLGVQWQWVGPGIPFLWKVGTGDYLLPVVGLSTFWAVVTPVAGTTVTYLSPRVRPFYATSANGNNAGIRINTFALSAGDFVAADMSFGLALYGSP